MFAVWRNTELNLRAPISHRIWDVANRQKSKSVIVVKSKERGGRTKVTTAAYSKDGKQIACGELVINACYLSMKLHPDISDVACSAIAGLDGTIHLWATNSNFARPSSVRPNYILTSLHRRDANFALFAL